MKKILLIVLLTVVFFSFLAGCGDKIHTWRVTKSTGLYAKPDADAEKIETLSTGTKVKDILEKDYFSQCFITEGIEVCKVSVVETGQEGYVIIKWLDD